MAELPVHSPLGASSAKRWLTCKGSVTLGWGLEGDTSEHAAIGTAAHALAAHCLKDGSDAWEYIGDNVCSDGGIWSGDPNVIVAGETKINKEMADAVQVYLDFIRRRFPEHDEQTFIETRFHCPTIDSLFYGTVDWAKIMLAKRRIAVVDYKHGAGIVVEVKDNEQEMYYGVGILETFDLWEKVDFIDLYIVQPRGFHSDGVIRSYTIPVSDIIAWLEDVLIPGMQDARVSRETKSGEHCRFCPVLARDCPQIAADIKELEEAVKDGKPVDQLTDAEMARRMDLFEIHKMANTAYLKSAYSRLMAGGFKGVDYKLAAAKSNREYKEGAEEAAVAKFGDKAYEDRKLKTPAQLDQLPGGEAFTAQYAFKPDKGLTVVKGSDSRPEVSRDTKSAFKPVKRGRK